MTAALPKMMPPKKSPPAPPSQNDLAASNAPLTQNHPYLF